MIDRIFKPNGHRWSNDEVRKLMAAWQADESVDTIATSIGVSKAAIGKMVVRLRQEGIPLKRRTRGNFAGRRGDPWSQSDIEFLLRRRRERATVEEISSELGRTIYAVHAMIQTLRKEGVEVATFGAGCRRKWNPTVAMAAIPIEP